MVDEQPPLTAPELRTLFARAVKESGSDRMSHISFYRWLRERGLTPKGGWPKERHRSIYNALTKRTDFVLVDPGVFKVVNSADWD